MKAIVLICTLLLFPTLLLAQDSYSFLDTNLFDPVLLKKVSSITVYDSVDKSRVLTLGDTTQKRLVNKTDTTIYILKDGRMITYGFSAHTKIRVDDSLIYNKFGKIRSRYSFNRDGVAYLSQEYIPDSLGNIIAEVEYYRRHNGTSRSDTTQFYQYHKNGSLKESFNPGMDDTITRLYDTLGRMVQETYKYHSHIRWIKYCYWSKDGTEMAEEYTHPGEELITTQKCHRYKNGKELEMIETSFSRQKKEVSRDTVYSTFDDRGFLLAKYANGRYMYVSYNKYGLPESIIERSRKYPEKLLSIVRYKYTFRK